jgi:hypothetical protein
LPPKGNIIVEGGLTDIKISTSQVIEAMVVYWVLEDIGAGDCRPRCEQWNDRSSGGTTIMAPTGLTERYIFKCARNAADSFPGTKGQLHQVRYAAQTNIICVPDEEAGSATSRKILMAGILNIQNVEFNHSGQFAMIPR